VIAKFRLQRVVEHGWLGGAFGIYIFGIIIRKGLKGRKS
jgi:hypothetical protein